MSVCLRVCVCLCRRSRAPRRIHSLSKRNQTLHVGRLIDGAYPHIVALRTEKGIHALMHRGSEKQVIFRSGSSGRGARKRSKQQVAMLRHVILHRRQQGSSRGRRHVVSPQELNRCTIASTQNAEISSSVPHSFSLSETVPLDDILFTLSHSFPYVFFFLSPSH